MQLAGRGAGPTWSINEKGWQLVKESLVRMRLRKLAHELVKLEERPVSRGLGRSNSALEPLGSVLKDLREGGTKKALASSSWLPAGGMNDGTIGGAR